MDVTEIQSENPNYQQLGAAGPSGAKRPGARGRRPENEPERDGTTTEGSRDGQGSLRSLSGHLPREYTLRSNQN